MADLPVVKYPGSIGIGFVVQGRPSGMAMTPDLYGRCVIPDNMEVVVRRAGDCIEVVTRPQSRLIEADLLSALKRLVADYEGVPDPTDADGQSVFDSARAAIAKATGAA